MAEPALTQRRRVFNDPQDDDIDVHALMWGLWRHRVLIGSVTVICALLGLALGLSAKRLYEAEVALAVSAPKIDVAGDRAGVRASTADFRPFIENSATAGQVIQEFKLNQSPYSMSATSFFDDVVTIEEIRNSTVMVLKARLGDPIMAKNVVNRVAALASETTSRVSRQEGEKAQNDLKAQLDESVARRNAAERAYREFREKSQIELLRRDVDSLLAERGNLLALLVRVETERSKLATAESELAARQRIDTVTRHVESEPAMVEDPMRKPTSPGDVMTFAVKNEQLNTTYQKLDEQVASTRTDLAGLERQKAQLIDVHKLSGGQLTQLTDLYNKESELARLQMERDLATRVYLEVANSYETARLHIAGRSSDLQLIAPALVPDRPMSRRVAMKALTLAAVGLLLSAIGALLYDTFIDRRQSPSNVAVGRL